MDGSKRTKVVYFDVGACWADWWRCSSDLRIYSIFSIPRSSKPVHRGSEIHPFQLSVPITETEDGFPARVPEGISVAHDCIRPVHTVEENIIQVTYGRPHNFTLGHFLFYWLGNDLLRYDTQVYVNDNPQNEGDLRGIVLEEGYQIKIEFLSRR